MKSRGHYEDGVWVKESPRVKLHKGDIICYRPNLVTVLSVDDEGAWIRGPYSEEQKIDWEDIETYNPGMYKK